MSMRVDLSFFDQVRKVSTTNSLVLDIKRNVSNLSKESFKFKIGDDLLFFEERLFIPKGPTRLLALQTRHHFPAVGHLEFNKTLEFLERLLVA